MRLRLRFQPRVKVLSDEQIDATLRDQAGSGSPATGRGGRSSGTGPDRSPRWASPPSSWGPGSPCGGPPAAVAAGALPGPEHDLVPGDPRRRVGPRRDPPDAARDDANTLPKRPVPKFRNLEQPNVFAFVQAAAAFENTGTGVYQGALFAVQQTEEYFPVAAGLTTVEARHAGFLNALLDGPLVPEFFPVDSPIPQSVALSHVDPFIANLNGGTVPEFDPVTPPTPTTSRSSISCSSWRWSRRRSTRSTSRSSSAVDDGIPHPVLT